jgi:hypothetical protein
VKTNERCSEDIKVAVDWLDLYMPEWYKKIDLDKFNFMDPETCIAGQLGLIPSIGFDSPLDTDHEDFDWSYAFMDTLWREIVKARQAR